MLTTHYVLLCKIFQKQHKDKIENICLKVKKTKTGKLKYLYKMCKGISKIKGASQIIDEFIPLPGGP
jgi:hypothetical protein